MEPNNTQPQSIREPDLKGERWSAWRCDLSQLVHHVPQQAATMALWLLHCPGAHPMWSYYVMCLIHLRPIPGETQPAHREYPEAEYELIVGAVDPKVEPDPDDIEGFARRVMSPLDQRDQFHGVTDRHACHVVELMARACTDEILCPESGFRQLWQSTLHNTISHYSGGHGVGLS